MAKQDSRRSSGSTSIDDHVARGDSVRKVTFERLRNGVLALFPMAVEKVLAGYVGYGLGMTRTGRLQKTFLQVEVHKHDVLLYLRPCNYLDPRQVVEQAPAKRAGTCDRLVRVRNVSEIDYAMGLVRQSYEDVDRLEKGSNPREK